MVKIEFWTFSFFFLEKNINLTNVIFCINIPPCFNAYILFFPCEMEINSNLVTMATIFFYLQHSFYVLVKWIPHYTSKQANCIFLGGIFRATIRVFDPYREWLLMHFISIIILRPFNILTKCNIQLVRNVYFVRHTQEVSQILIELVQWNGRYNESRQVLFHWSMTCTFCANLSLLTWYK